jgi:hypothetical protein
VEEAAVQVLENFVEMIVMTGGRVDLLSSPHLAHQARLRGNVMASNIATVASTLDPINGFSMSLASKNDAMACSTGSERFQKIRDANKSSLTKRIVLLMETKE